MSDSLQDQLLALGLAKEKPKAAPGGRKQKHHARKAGNGKGGRAKQRQSEVDRAPASGKGGEISLDAAYRARQKDEKTSSERARAEKRALDLERRRINTEIENLLKDQSLNDREGALKRNFLYKGKIRSVRVNEAQLKALNEGALALVFLRGDYLLVTPELAARVARLSPEHIPDLGGDAPEEEEFPVPDDLIW